MVGADRERPAVTHNWDQQLQRRLADRSLADVKAELHYSSWAKLGDAIADSANASPEWARYAEDVLEHLRRKQLLSYEGAPVITDLEGGLTIGNAVEVFNRCVRAAYLLLTEIRDNPRLEGLVDAGGRASLQMGRDSFSTVLTQPVHGFTTTTLICAMRREYWPTGAGVFVCFDLVHEDGPQLVVGAYRYHRTVPADIAIAYADSGPGDLGHSALRPGDHSVLKHAWVYGNGVAEFLCAERPWEADETRGGADIDWVLDRLDDASAVWGQNSRRGGRSRLSSRRLGASSSRAYSADEEERSGWAGSLTAPLRRRPAVMTRGPGAIATRDCASWRGLRALSRVPQGSSAQLVALPKSRLRQRRRAA